MIWKLENYPPIKIESSSKVSVILTAGLRVVWLVNMCQATTKTKLIFGAKGAG